MSQTKKPVALALGAAVATGTLLAGSMFSMQAMAQGYMQDAAAKTTAEGKCGEGKCGEGKCGEGKCGGEKKADAGEQAHGMASMDTDKDGRLSRAEFDAAHKGSEEKFAGHDGDGDGFITQAEMDAHHAEMKKAKPADKTKAEGKCGDDKSRRCPQIRRHNRGGDEFFNAADYYVRPFFSQIGRHSAKLGDVHKSVGKFSPLLYCCLSLGTVPP